MASTTTSSQGELQLTKLLSTLHVSHKPETFVFLTFPPPCAPPPSLFQQMSFLESEGLTVVSTLDSTRAHGLEGRFPSAMITCEVHSALEGVGFMATLSRTLSKYQIPCNVVAGYFRDHLFVPEDRAEEAIKLSEDLASQSQERAVM